MAVQFDGPLCQQCVDIDLEKVFAGGYETPHLVAEIGTVPESQLHSKCPLCRLVAEAVYRPFNDPSLASYHEDCRLCDSDGPKQLGIFYLFGDEIKSNTQYQDGMGHSKTSLYRETILVSGFERGVDFSRLGKTSRPISQSQVSDLQSNNFCALKIGRLKNADSKLIAFYGSIYPAFGGAGKPAPARLLNPTYLDWTLLQTWIATCLSTHVECGAALSMDTQPLIKQFRLIDCETRRLEYATGGEQYVALSYVWGQPEKESTEESQCLSSELSSKIPLVVDDAMQVVRRMGLRYLWVDRYCIPRDSEMSLREHLAKMHLVYQRAQFTIVAAAGEDSSYGLPGVSTRARHPQKSATIEGLLMVSALRPFHSHDRQIKWNSRAWTYQEGIFSPRQLIFDSHQVHFRCGEGTQREILSRIAEADTSSQLLHGGARSLSIWEHIELYSNRKLTYDTDALNGIVSIMNAFNDGSKGPVQHVWGLPFARDLNSVDGATHSWPTSPGPLHNAIFPSATSIFGYSLTWAARGFSQRVMTLHRRQDFPTWSWTCCPVGVGFMRLPWGTQGQPVIPDPELEVSVECLNGTILSLSEYLTTADSLEPSRYLHVEGWSVGDVLIFNPEEGKVTIDLDEKYELTATIGVETVPDENIYQEFFQPLIEGDGRTKRWDALIVCFAPQDFDSVIKPFMITLVKIDDPTHPGQEVYERIGHIEGLTLVKKPKARQRVISAKRERQSPHIASVSRSNDDELNNTLLGTRGLDSRYTSEVATETENLTKDGGVEGEITTIVEEPPGMNISSCSNTPTLVPMGGGGGGEYLREHIPACDDDKDDTESSSDGSTTDSDDFGDYTINQIIYRENCKHYFPRIPRTRRKFILR